MQQHRAVFSWDKAKNHPIITIWCLQQRLKRIRLFCSVLRFQVRSAGDASRPPENREHLLFVAEEGWKKQASSLVQTQAEARGLIWSLCDADLILSATSTEGRATWNLTFNLRSAAPRTIRCPRVWTAKMAFCVPQKDRVWSFIPLWVQLWFMYAGASSEPRITKSHLHVEELCCYQEKKKIVMNMF